ncbi:MAG TPA: hypothetical protein VK826_13400 [Bacteroidia bacterium]|nr:hypothetical protein [Bacteroidia bacterium]
MLTPFAPHDLVKLNARIRGTWMQVLLVTLLIVGAATLMACVGKYSRDPSTFFIFVGIFEPMLLLGMLPTFIGLYHDQQKQQKIAGNFIVEKNVSSDRYFTYFYLRVNLNGRSRKIQVTKLVYDVVLPDETLWFEFAEHSRTLLLLRREGISLVS